MALGSCKVKKEDTVGAGPQKLAVHLSLTVQYAGHSSDDHVLLIRATNKRKALLLICRLFSGFKVSCIYI